MTTKITKTSEGKTTYTWNAGYWVQQGDGGTLEEYYDEDKLRRLLNRLNKGAEQMAFGIKNTKGVTVYMPQHFACIQMLSYEIDGKKYSQHTRKNDKNGYEVYFVAEYGTRRWVQKTGEDIGAMIVNDELALMKALAKSSKYDFEMGGVKNRRGRAVN